MLLSCTAAEQASLVLLTPCFSILGNLGDYLSGQIWLNRPTWTRDICIGIVLFPQASQSNQIPSRCHVDSSGVIVGQYICRCHSLANLMPMHMLLQRSTSMPKQAVSCVPLMW